MRTAADPTGLFGVNYQPSAHPSREQWSSGGYDGARRRADLELAAALGFNTVRVFLPTSAYDAPDASGGFNLPHPLPTQLARLTDFCSRAAAAGVGLHLSLFDLCGNYGLIDQCQAWAEAVIGACDLSVVSVIELQNETPFESTSAYTGGYDRGYTGERGLKQGETAALFAQMMIPHLRTLAPGIPVVTASYDSRNTAPLASLVAAVECLHGTPALPDWYEFHYYHPPGGAFNVLAAAQRVCRGVPVRVGETNHRNVHKGQTRYQLTAQQEHQLMSDYIQAVRAACQKLGLGEPTPWYLIDLTETQTQFTDAADRVLGLYDVDAKLKAPGLMYRRYPPGTLVPPVFNPSLSHPNVDGAIPPNTLPQSWYLYRGQGVSGAAPAQPISASTAGGVVTLTGSGTTSSSDNPPTLQTVPLGFPITPAGAYTFRAVLTGEGDTGSSHGYPIITIVWYDEYNEYIATVPSPALPLTSTPRACSVSSAAPPNAAFMQLNVSVGWNAGTITVRDVSIAGPGVAGGGGEA